MRYGLWALAALVVGAFGAHFLLQDRGYVLINFRTFFIEMSVPILVLALVLLYAGVRLAIRIWRAPRQLGEAVAARQHRRTADKLTRGLIHLTEGDYKRGERLLTDSLHASDSKLVNYLMAARAAQQQGSAERRDEWLSLARESEPDAEVAVLLTQAELQLAAGEPRAALATLARIEQQKPKHPGLLVLLTDVHLKTGDNDALLAVLPRLAKAKLPPEQLAPLLARGLDAMRRHAAFDLAGLNSIFSPLPLGLRRRPALIRARALLLDKLGKGDDAVKALVAGLKREWNPDLVAAFGEVRGSDGLRQLRRAESWLKEHGEDATLLKAAARLCMANELWGKARSYLETSLALQPEPAAYAVYGELLDRLGEPDEAARAYQAGLRMVAPATPELPALEAPDLSEAEG